jgi:hypothetical protein
MGKMDSAFVKRATKSISRKDLDPLQKMKVPQLGIPRKEIL